MSGGAKNITQIVQRKMTAVSVTAMSPPQSDSMRGKASHTNNQSNAGQVTTESRKRSYDDDDKTIVEGSGYKRNCNSTVVEYEAPWYRGYQAAVRNESNTKPLFLTHSDIAKGVPPKQNAQSGPPLGTTLHYATGIRLFADGNYNMQALINFLNRKVCPDTTMALMRRNSRLPVYVYRGDQRLRNQLAHLRGTVVDLSGVALTNEAQLTQRLNKRTQVDMMV